MDTKSDSRNNYDKSEINGDVYESSSSLNGGGGGQDGGLLSYLIIRPEKGGIGDLYRYMVRDDIASGLRFLEGSDEGLVGKVAADHRWVILVSIIVRKIVAFFGKPMQWTGYAVDFFLNLLSLNGNLTGLLCNLLRGKVVLPQRDTGTFISTIGHLDGRIDLYKGQSFLQEEEGDAVFRERSIRVEIGNRNLMDLCIMASKLAYENAEVVRNIVLHHWKMHFVKFYNCWNDFQKEMSTQVFILCDKPKDANLILISFRGTEPFDADDWSTDFDYSWYEIPELGKVHMGFLEALGLGNRADVVSFQNHLRVKDTKFSSSNGGDVRRNPSEDTGSISSNTDSDLRGLDQSSDSESPTSADTKKISPDMVEMTAYYSVKSKLKSLLKEHKNAKFVVTGHSLGGALAILFPTVLVLHEEMEIMQRLSCVYTFGQPRVGNKELGRFMEAHLNYPVPKYFRVVYCNDLVPRLPYDDKTFLYKHFGACLYYDSLYTEKNMDEEPNRNYFGMRYVIPAYLNAVWELIRSLTMGYTHGPEYKEGWFSILLRVIGLALPGISAHCPTDYVNSARLGKERIMQMSSF
ncbi:triacylglycerol lipase OBL1 [Juglans microcarpa x Juglans regia]|uniref:triacylglycerol lipase OBL1 n=1 Tax=Juglans microcarpa x Juglans regia TaxID=2249226 RepID=UPI001B7F3B1A|nr:triacylglycerol lipase OBL1 [Juglans microcarpa x Juglans regia]